MKKQYRYYETTSFRYILELYHDGEFIKYDKYWLDELNEEIDKLKEQGYTLGFTKEQVEESKQCYEKRLENIID